MTADDLRTRIAQAIFKRFECPHGDLADISDEWESWWFQGSDEDRKPFYDQADAVIRELCLHREEMSEWAVFSEGFRGHRYVTHWQENDPAPVTKIRSAKKLGLTGDGE